MPQIQYFKTMDKQLLLHDFIMMQDDIVYYV